MKNPLIFIKEFWGIDENLVYSILFKLWGLVKSPLTIAVIIIYLDEVEQGYWYTFVNLGALTVFAELGFTMVLIQMVSHEFAHLKFDGTVSGPAEYVVRLFSLIGYAIRLYSWIIPIAFAVLSTVGTVFLYYSGKDAVDFPLLMAWMAYSLSGALMLMVSIAGAIVQGLNQIARTQRILFLAGIVSTAVLIVSLFLGLKLWALGISGLFNFAVCALLLLRGYQQLIQQTKIVASESTIDFKKEIFSLQWRFAISWICGYFIFNLITPLTLHYIGASDAGKLGLSLSITRAVSNIATAWGIVKVPQLNMLASRKDFPAMNNLIKQIQTQSLSIFFLGVVAVLLVLYFVFPYFGWQDRILPMREFLILMASEIAVVIVFNYSFYLRAFKKEPYLQISMLNALLSLISFLVGLKLLGSIYYTILFFTVIQLTLMFLCVVLFFRKRSEYENLR